MSASNELEAPDGSAFVQARLSKLTELEHKFMAARQVTAPLTDTPAPAIADAEVFAGEE